MIERIEDSGSSLTEEDIARAERVLQVKFPAPYRDFLRRHNGGEPVPDGFPDGSEASTLQYFFSVSDEQGNLIEMVDDMRIGNRIPPEYLPVGIDSFGNFVCLSVDGPSAGKVYFWDHEALAGEGLIELAEDFDAFCETFFE